MRGAPKVRRRSDQGIPLYPSFQVEPPIWLAPELVIKVKVSRGG